MANLKRILPLLLLFSLAYGAWYYWHTRPRKPVKGRIVQLEANEVESMEIKPVNGLAFFANRSADGWLLSTDAINLPQPSYLPDSLLDKLLRVESLDLVADASTGHLLTQLFLQSRHGENYHIKLYKTVDSLPYRAQLQIEPRPEIFALDRLDPADLPLAFVNYRSRSLLDLNVIGRLDSLSWSNGNKQNSYWSRPDSAAQLDVLTQNWQPLQGDNFADQFDEVAHRNRYRGSFMFYGARDEVELRVYLDSNWAKPLVLWGTQFPGAYFALDSLEEIGLRLPSSPAN